jgi:signal peptidase I
MTPTIESGDFILAEKVSYGSRVITSIKLDINKEPSFTRMMPLRHIQRGDVLVFNFPFRESNDTICINLTMHLIKRCVGLAGDTLSIVNGDYFIAGIPNSVSYRSQQNRIKQFLIELSSTPCTFPFDSDFQWNTVNFGPLYIPAAGASIELTPRNFKLYHKLITYETQSTVLMRDSLVYINDAHAISYTFRCNWYFMAGDNTMNSQDSRYLGLIPEHYIISKAFIILSSRNMYSGKRNWKKIMKRIK